MYRGSDGRFVSEQQLWERLELGQWRVLCWDERSGEEWVETEREDLLHFDPVDESDLPDGVAVERVNGIWKVVDEDGESVDAAPPW